MSIPFFLNETALTKDVGVIFNPKDLITLSAVSRASASLAISAFLMCFRHIEWKVPTFMDFTERFPLNITSSLSLSSLAALLVNVTAVISDGSTPYSFVKNAILHIRVLVFPVPGPAITATALSCALAASSCLSLRPIFFSFSVIISVCSSSCFLIFLIFSFLGFLSVFSSNSKSLSCPSILSLSAELKTDTFPYSPSYPAMASTFPSLRFFIP